MHGVLLSSRKQDARIYTQLFPLQVLRDSEDMWKIIAATKIEEIFEKKFYDMFMTQGGKWPSKAKLLDWLKNTGIVFACFMFSFIFKLR